VVRYGKNTVPVLQVVLFFGDHLKMKRLMRRLRRRRIIPRHITTAHKQIGYDKRNM
jgi:hypothetical protein